MWFKLWSESNPAQQSLLKPIIQKREWSILSSQEKHQIRKHLEIFFFDKKTKEKYNDYWWYVGIYYDFDSDLNKKIIYSTIQEINNKYKINCYTPTFLEKNSINQACYDFINIFDNDDSNIFLEMISIYCYYLIQAKPKDYVYKKPEESTEEFEYRNNENQYLYFDEFAKSLNEVFGDYWLNIYLTRDWWIDKQEEKIIHDIYEPVIKCLSIWNYKEVERDLSDAFEDYNKKDYSGSITKWFSAVQWFLQIKVKWEIWKGDFAWLIKQGIKNKIIEDDIFTTTIFKDIESIISRYRMENADSHPKLEYANERSAQLFLNLIMIFIQHCMQK